MRVYNRCRHCNSLLDVVKRKPDAFCDQWCKKEHTAIVNADPYRKRASKKFNMAAVRTPNGTLWVQEPLWRDDE